MNKRQAKKKQKNREESEWLYFMSGLYPVDYTAARHIRRWVNKEMKNER